MRRVVSLLVAGILVTGHSSSSAWADSSEKEHLSKFHSSSSDHASGCGEISPARYYWEIERPLQLAAKATSNEQGDILDPSPTNRLNVDLVRELRPDITRKKYTIHKLSCWTKSGDPLAPYLAFMVINDIYYPEEIYNYKIKKKIGRSFLWLNVAAKPKLCNGLSEEEKLYFGCRFGLPEAQYTLAICSSGQNIGCGLTANEGLQFCNKSVHQGLFVANRLCSDLMNRISK